MGFRAQTADDTITGINLTPFVDVALVLLVIFMVTLHLDREARAIPWNLPHSSPTTSVRLTVAVAIDAAGTVWIDSERTTDAPLAAQIQARMRENPNVHVILAAVPSTTHGRVVRVIDTLRAVGVRSWSIQVDAP